MSGIGTTCVGCGSNEFEVVDCQRVCTTCGILINDSTLVTDYATECGPSSEEFRGYARSLPTKYAAMNDTSRKPCLYAIARLKEICSVLHFTDDMTNEARNLLERVIVHTSIIYKKYESKLHVAAACAYIVSQLRHWPMSVEHIANISGHPRDSIIYFKKFITQEYGIKLEHLDITEIIKPMASTMGLSETCCRCAEDITFLCKDTWLTNGRNPVGIVTAAIYLAWKCENIAERNKVKYSDFAKRHNQKVVNTVSRRLAEMIDLFVMLARQLPWMPDDKKLDKKTVIEFIPDVCRYKTAMMKKALIAASRENDPNSNNEHSNNIKSNNENSNAEDSKMCIKTEPVDPEEQLSDTSGVKRKFTTDSNLPTDSFLPPCFKMARRNSKSNQDENKEVCSVNYKGDLNDEELGEHDIPENELCQYIRSEREVQVLKVVSLAGN